MSSVTVIQYTQEVINSLQKQGRTALAHNYNAFAKKFRSFNEGKDTKLSDVTADVVCRFADHLIYIDKVTKNTQSFYCRIFKAIYNRAVNAEITKDKKPFRKVFTGNEKTVHRALSDVDLRRFYQYLPKDKDERTAKDMFMLSFFLRGISPIDLFSLTRENVRGNAIEYRRSKTGQLLTIGKTKEITDILDKYGKDDEDMLLYKAIRSGIKTTQTYINRHLRHIGEKLEFPIPLTMYVARHTWASVARDMDIEVPIISQGLGHDNIVTTQIYLSSISTNRINKANERIIDFITNSNL